MNTSSAGSVQQFCYDLRQLHIYAGKPSPAQMALTTGRAPATFKFLAEQCLLPRWDEVSALLMATGHQSTMPSWRRRWALLHGELRRAQQQSRPPIPLARTDDLAAVDGAVGGDGPIGHHLVGPIASAMAASTPQEFCQALEKLRLEADVSFATIARSGVLSKSTAHRMVTKGELPCRRDTLDAFVRACGHSASEAAQWWSSAERIRRGDPPTFHAAAIPASELVLRAPETELPGLFASTPKRSGFAQVRADNARLRAENRQLQAELRDVRVLLDSAVRAFRTVNRQRQVAAACRPADAHVVDPEHDPRPQPEAPAVLPRLRAPGGPDRNPASGVIITAECTYAAVNIA